MRGPRRRPGRPQNPQTAEESEKQVEDILVRETPSLIRILVKAAKSGDTKAAQYLVDRQLGKAAEKKNTNADRWVDGLKALAEIVNGPRAVNPPPAQPALPSVTVVEVVEGEVTEVDGEM